MKLFKFLSRAGHNSNVQSNVVICAFIFFLGVSGRKMLQLKLALPVAAPGKLDANNSLNNITPFHI